MELWKGRVGSEVYAVHNGKQVIKNYSPKEQMPTIRQQIAQDKFNTAVWYWKNFYRNIMPLNKFIQQYLRYPQRYPDTRFNYDLASLTAGDLLFFDKTARKYCTVKQQQLAQILEDYDEPRYATNWDTFAGYQDNVAHFVARDDAAQSQPVYNNNQAATACFYRLEIKAGIEGSITFSATSGNSTIETKTISWGAENTLDQIVAMFTQLNANNITFAKLADNTGVGLEIGGYGANTLTVTGTPSNCKVIDCSGYAFLQSQNPTAPEVGGTFNPGETYTYLDPGIHHNFRGDTARTILGSALVTGSTIAIAVDDYNYSYRCGLNFARFKAWATTGGENTFYDDGEDEQSGGSHVADPGAHVMNEATFNAGVRDYTGSDVQHLGMKDYYTHLFNDQTGDYATRRQQLEAMYGQMTGTPGLASYDAYLMNHMLDAGANSGITSMMRNKGFDQTVAKADCMNVTYNYVIVPAYPPEYNAQHYGVTASEGFAPGVYYHPEPADLALMFRDDIMPLINANITASGGGTQLSAASGVYRGSCADYSASSAWCFSGVYGCFADAGRSGGYFRCRPCLAIEVQSLTQSQRQARNIKIEPEKTNDPTPEETPVEEPGQEMR